MSRARGASFVVPTSNLFFLENSKGEKMNEENCGNCAYCLNRKTRKKVCALQRSKKSRQKAKEKKWDYERKYSLSKLLLEELEDVERPVKPKN